MAIPDFQTIMLPLLKLTSDGKEHSTKEAIEMLAKHFGLTEKEKNEQLPSGTQAAFYNRVVWARIYLTRAGVLETPSRARFKITAEGKKVLASKPDRIDMRFLKRFPKYVDWRKTFESKGDEGEKEQEKQHKTPEETLETGYENLRRSLAHDLLEQVKQCSPRFFEKLVVELLLKMGYGGSLKEAGEVIGKSGDGGIDGIIKEDKLGLDVVYIQAKRWEGSVSAGSVRDFSGSLDYHGAKKGVFITTSTYTNDAKQFVGKIGEKKIVLIDGYELAQLMIENDVGVSTVATYAVKKIDSDYFEEE